MSHNKPYAEFVGYQQDERVGGVRAWYVIQAPGHARHLSTVFAPTLIQLGIEIPKTPPYFPKSKLKEVWVFKCENEQCHISYLDKKQVMEHVKERGHYQIVQELIKLSEVEKAEPIPQPKKAINLKEDEDDLPKKKPKLVLIGTEPGEPTKIELDSYKDSLSLGKKEVPEVILSKKVDYTPKKDYTEEAKKEALDFRKKIQDKFSDIDWKD